MNLQQLTLLQGYALDRDLIDRPVHEVLKLFYKDKEDNELTELQMWRCVGYQLAECMEVLDYGKYEKMFHKYCSDFISGVA